MTTLKKCAAFCKEIGETPGRMAWDVDLSAWYLNSGCGAMYLTDGEASAILKEWLWQMIQKADSWTQRVAFTNGVFRIHIKMPAPAWKKEPLPVYKATDGKDELALLLEAAREVRG